MIIDRFIKKHEQGKKLKEYSNDIGYISMIWTQYAGHYYDKYIEIREKLYKYPDDKEWGRDLILNTLWYNVGKVEFFVKYCKLIGVEYKIAVDLNKESNIQNCDIEKFIGYADTAWDILNELRVYDERPDKEQLSIVRKHLHFEEGKHIKNPHKENIDIGHWINEQATYVQTYENERRIVKDITKEMQYKKKAESILDSYGLKVIKGAVQGNYEPDENVFQYLANTDMKKYKELINAEKREEFINDFDMELFSEETETQVEGNNEYTNTLNKQL